MKTTKTHAETELDLILGSDEMDQMMKANVLELVDTFSKQGHSGFSASYCVELFEKVAMHKQLSPILGTDEEWMDVGEYGKPDGVEKLYQNKRLSSVFKSVTNGKSFCYDIDSVVRYDISNDGTKIYFTSGKDYRRKEIKFPYTQKTKYKFSWTVDNVFNFLKSKF
jgi:hypothetical protein